jgi:hypothetical protein
MVPDGSRPAEGRTRGCMGVDRDRHRRHRRDRGRRRGGGAEAQDRHAARAVRARVRSHDRARGGSPSGRRRVGSPQGASCTAGYPPAVAIGTRRIPGSVARRPGRVRRRAGGVAAAGRSSRPYPSVVESYRAAHAISESTEADRATTEDIRQGFVHYRTLFEDLLDVNGGQLRAAREA